MNEYIQEIVKQYFLEEEWTLSEGCNGYNNTTRFLMIDPKGEAPRRYIMRIYESHQDEEKVRFEHEVLSVLQGKTSLQVPEVIRTLSGHSIAKASDGKLVSIARYIEGENPVFTEPNQLDRKSVV